MSWTPITCRLSAAFCVLFGSLDRGLLPSLKGWMNFLARNLLQLMLFRVSRNSMCFLGPVLDLLQVVAIPDPLVLPPAFPTTSVVQQFQRLPTHWTIFYRIGKCKTCRIATSARMAYCL